MRIRVTSEPISVAEGWQKSSYSSINGNCLEWRKSSHSFHEANCTEVAAGPGYVAVRDSKDPDGPVLEFTPAQWQVFIASIKLP